MLDLEVIPYISDKAPAATKQNPAFKVFAVINKASANPKNNEVNQAKEYLTDFPILKLINTVIHDRKQFRDAIIESLSVSEMGSSKAKDEL
ncbi:ATPase, partial [Acinetobacter baumannii]|nr:ATPase [Acinetobacter baumannii]